MNPKNDPTDGVLPSVQITAKRNPSKAGANTGAYFKGLVKRGAQAVFPIYGAYEGIKNGYHSVINWTGSVSNVMSGNSSWRDVANITFNSELPAVVDLVNGISNGDEAAYEALGGMTWDLAAGIWGGYTSMSTRPINASPAPNSIVRMSTELLDQSLAMMGPERIGNYSVYGNKALIGNTYTRNIFELSVHSGSGSYQNFRGLVLSFETEAIKSGASGISIYGSSVINKGFLNPQIATRFGYSFEHVGDGVFLQKKF